MKTVDEEELLTVSINTVNRSDIISVTPKIEGKYLKLELDTGSAISVIPIRIYKELFHHKPLSVTKTRLKTYSGQTISPAGIINVSVNYEGQEHNLDLFVVKNDSPSLFGRAWLKYIKLDWNSIKFLQTGKTTDENLQEILESILLQLSLFALLLYVQSQQLWSWQDGQITYNHTFFLGKLEQAVNQYLMHILCL